MKVSENEIVITSLWHACNFNETHDKTHYNRLNLYYMKLDTTNDTFYNVHGKKLTLPITAEASDKYTLAYDSEKAGETSFGTRPLILEDGRTAAAYEARGKDYREWRMALFENGSWTHGHPMPGTVNRALYNKKGKAVNKIFALEIFDGKKDKAAVTYRDANGKSVFAIAKRIAKAGSQKQTWQVEKINFSVAKAKLQLKAVKDPKGNAQAFIVNVRKGLSQRLYLWHDGELRGNH
jgi:hypothetical protein